MALPKRFTDVTFTLRTDDSNTFKNHAITVQNSSIEITPEYFSGSSYKESIGGKRISDVRGFRVKFNLSYGASSQANGFQEFFNDVIKAFRDGTVTISSTEETFTQLDIAVNGTRIKPDDSGAFTPFILEDLSYTQTYRDQIGRFVPSITLCSESIIPSIPETLEGVL